MIIGVFLHQVWVCVIFSSFLFVLVSLNWVSKSPSVTSGTTSSRTLLSKVTAFVHGSSAKKFSLEKEPACWEKVKSALRKSSSYLHQSFTELLAAMTKQSHKRRGYNSLSVSWQIITQGKIFSGAEIAVHYACFLLLIIFLQQQNPQEVTRMNLLKAYFCFPRSGW